MEITLKFLTPAFLYGADKTKPEFRIPSLIGQMRYWWRMTQDWSDVEGLRKMEAAIFGLGDLGAKSFYIYLSKKPEIRNSMQPDPVMQRGQPVPGKYSFPTKKSGVSYFFYPFMRHEGLFKWFSEDSQAHFIIEFTKDADQQQVLLSLFLLNRFGGLGARSRRGAGSVELSGDEIFDLTEKDLREYIISEQRTSMPVHSCFKSIHQNSPLWLALKNNARIKKSDPPQSRWDDSMHIVGSKMQNFRTKQNLCAGNTGGVDPDFINEAIALHQYFNDPVHHLPPNPILKDAFGLPRIINFTSCNPPARNALTVTAYRDKGHNDFEESRRASPLHITVNQNNGKYYCTLLVLWDGLDFLPANSGIDIRVKSKNNRIIDTYPVIEHPPVDKLEDFLKLSPLTDL